MKALSIYALDELEDRVPAHALVAGVDLVVIRYDDTVSVLYGRCAHRGAPIRSISSFLRSTRFTSGTMHARLKIAGPTLQKRTWRRLAELQTGSRS